MERQRTSGNDPEAGGQVRREYEDSTAYLRDILRSIVEIGASLRLQMDTETLLKRIVTTSCQALRFRYAAIYLDDGAGFFRVASTCGVDAAEEAYLRCHPLPGNVVARIVDECYRVSDSYFLPAEAPIWQDETFARYFVVPHLAGDTAAPAASLRCESDEWQDADLMLVPLVSGDEQLLGFLTPDFPLSGQRPTREMMGLFELFANQAAVVIEGSRLSEELRAAVSQAREAERLKNNFLLTASHELRTPLTAIQGYLELLGEYGETLDAASRTRFIQNARRGCDELVLLLGNVLDVSYLDAERLVFNASPVPLARSVQTILDILEPIIVREKRSIEVGIPTELCVLADELRLRQILLNLVSNALKYTPAGSPVALRTEYKDAAYLRERMARSQIAQDQSRQLVGLFVLLTVHDQGPGIAIDEQPLLFTKFTRLARAKKSPQKGAGLGLYLCRQLVEAMGGCIWMESSGLDGEGASFFVALPAIETASV